MAISVTFNGATIYKPGGSYYVPPTPQQVAAANLLHLLIKLYVYPKRVTFEPL